MAKQIRGFAAMKPEDRVWIARKGGASVAPEKRSFSRNKELAKEAGAKGGRASRKKRDVAADQATQHDQAAVGADDR